MELQAAPGNKRRRKTFIFLFACIILLTIISLVFINLYLNPLAKSLFLQQTEPIFGDNLQIGSVNLSLWHGALVVKNLTLRQPTGFGDGYLIKTNSVRVRIALRPLLKKQLTIYGITMIKPEIHFIQKRNGHTNTEYYLNQMQETAQTSTHSEPFSIELKKILISKGQLRVESYRISEQQPSLLLTDLKLILKNFKLPNIDREKSSFAITGTISSQNPAKFKTQGHGVFLNGLLDFTADTTVNNITLTDFKHLYPPSTLTVKSGTAWVTADTRCKRNYIISNQHVEVKKLKITSSNKSLLKNTFIGIPANLFAKILEDKNNMLNFDFQIKGPVSELKVNIKEAINHSIAQSLKNKIKPAGSTDKKVLKNIKKSGSKVKNSLKKLFKKDK